MFNKKKYDKDNDYSYGYSRGFFARNAAIIFQICVILVAGVFLAFVLLFDFSKIMPLQESSEMPIVSSQEESSQQETESSQEPQSSVAPTPTPEPEKTQTITDMSEIDISTDGIDFTQGVFSLDGMFPDTILTETEDAGDDYIRDIVFVGESTTYGLMFYDMLPDSAGKEQVWTPTSGTLMLTNANNDIGKINTYNIDTGYSEDMLIKDAAAMYKPEYMVITLGLNGIGFYIEDDVEYYVGEYVKLLNSIMEASPDTKIIVQSVFPVGENYEYKISLSNTRINKANYLFAKMCDQMGIKFLNSAPIFQNENGDLKYELHNGDELHLSPAGLQAELDFIKTHKFEE